MTIEILQPIRRVIWVWGPDDKLTANFSGEELADDSYGYPYPVDAALLEVLQGMRTKCGLAIDPNSGFRSTVKNASLRGAASKSQHMVGAAADITIKSLKPIEIASLAVACGATGIGLAQSYCHVDVRPGSPESFAGWEYLAVGGMATMRATTRAKIMAGVAKWV